MKKGEEWEPHTSQPSPSPLPQFCHTPQPKWSGNKTDGFIDFMIWNDLWEKFWPSLKTINGKVVNVVPRVTLFLFGVRNVPHLLHSDLQSSSFFKNAIIPSPNPPLVHTDEVSFISWHKGSELSEKTVRSRISDAFEKVRGVSLAREELQVFRYCWIMYRNVEVCVNYKCYVWLVWDYL